MTAGLDRRGFLRGIAALGTLTLLVPKGGQALARPISDEAVRALLAGELAIYFRHAATTWSGIDRIDWPRERQRLLSEEGIAQSRQIGEAFDVLGAPVGEVLASPFARCRDMAEIAFGRVEERPELLGLLSDSEGRAARVDFLRERLATPTGGAGNRIIVSHRSNISEVAGVSLGEGDAVLIGPLGGGQFERLGTLTPNDWSALAAEAR